MKKRLLSGLTLLALLLQCLLLPAFAEPTDAPADPTEPSASETVADATEPDASEPGATDAAEPTAETAAPAENDKAPAAVTDETPPALNDFGQYLDTTVQARAAALVELNSDTLVYGMNLDEKVYPASLTKIMTCMLALEHGNLDDIVTVSHEALQDLNAAGSSAGLLEGEQLSLRELLYCVMISSANEACNVVAEYIAGDIPSFVALMNAQAAALGMTGTHFANAHGLHDENHYTTVRDLVTLARWAWQSEQFQEFSTQTSHTVPATNKSEERVLHTTNYLTSGQTVGKYYYDKARGIKTGFTTPAGGCLISTAEKDGVRLLCIVLGGKGTARANGTTDFGSFSDTLTAYRWVFSHYGWRAIVSASDLICEVPVRYGRDGDSVTVRPAQTVSAVLPAADSDGAPQFEQQVTIYSERDGKPLEAPIKAGDEVGELTVSYHGTVYGTVKLVAAVDVAVSKGAYIAGHVAAFFTNPIVLVILLAIVLALVGYVLWLVRRRKQIEAERRRRRRAQMEAEEARRRALAHETLREFDRDPAGSRRR